MGAREGYTRRAERPRQGEPRESAAILEKKGPLGGVRERVGLSRQLVYPPASAKANGRALASAGRVEGRCEGDQSKARVGMQSRHSQVVDAVEQSEEARCACGMGPSLALPAVIRGAAPAATGNQQHQTTWLKPTYGP